MKVLVLGHGGMLGHIVVNYLLENNINVEEAHGKWSTEEFIKGVLSFNGDYIVNCIGAIPQKTDHFEINYDLPIWLDKNAKCRVIHPGTDCEMDNDHYGTSKRNASDFIKIDGKNTKIIKASIIGHELETSFGLLEWFLNTEGEVSGYAKAYWNGATTLEWSKKCMDMMLNWDDYDIENILQSECISKYTLLKIISKVYNKDVVIRKYNSIAVNKCLVGGIKIPPIDIQLRELKEFCS